MPEENGDKTKTGVLDKAKDSAAALRKTLEEKAKQQVEELKQPEKTQLYRSMFRVKHDEEPRNRALSVLSNVFFHLHPAKVNRDATKYNFTWGMGGITFYLFIVLTFTGVLLMFYYHPSKIQAFRDILYLDNDVPFDYLLPDDQLGFWAVTVGTNMARATPLLGHEGPFGAQLGMTPYNDVRFALLGGSIVDANALLRAYIWHCIAIPLIAAIFMGLHFWRVRKDGGISGPAPVMLESEIKEEKGPRPVIMKPSGMR